MADRARLAEALALLASEAAELVEANRPLVVETVRDGAGAIIRIAPIPSSLGTTPASSTPGRSQSGAVTSILAERLVTAQQGTLAAKNGVLELRIGIAVPPPL